MTEQLYDSLEVAKRHEFKFQKDFAEIFLDRDLTDEDVGELLRQLIKVEFQLSSILEAPQFKNKHLKYVWSGLKNKAKAQVCGSLRNAGITGKDNELQPAIPPNTPSITGSDIPPVLEGDPESATQYNRRESKSRELKRSERKRSEPNGTGEQAERTESEEYSKVLSTNEYSTEKPPPVYEPEHFTDETGLHWKRTENGKSYICVEYDKHIDSSELTSFISQKLVHFHNPHTS